MLKKQVLVLAVGVLALSVAACGGRAARPVAETSDLDARITCDGISAEKEANVRRVAELADEKLANDIRNATKVVTFPLLGGVTTPLTFDLSLAIDEERRAIAKRDLRLDQLAVDKSCGGIVVELQGVTPITVEVVSIDVPVQPRPAPPAPELEFDVSAEGETSGQAQ
ncbi:MAG: hypothetical protein AAFQ73_08000 [Pseudomonadota bacterium]